ncbi:MAG: 4-hydroxy-tetrahydrodipicolinate reductase [Armatimonadota bacterium]|nr:4-hydroxy-tetrahydrodipicolinate reductase [bacterium]
MSEKIRVAVLGACGKMGREVMNAVAGADDMELVGACDVYYAGTNASDATGVKGLDFNIESDFNAMLEQAKPNVVVDFAKPFVMDNIRKMLKSGVVPVIGTTGIASDELDEISALAENTGTGAMVIPNFAIGAVLMMKFAAEAAKYMPNVEIIELHHDKKIDSPSGTAIKTAEMIDASRKAAGVDWTRPMGSNDDPARGETRCEIQIHSVRLPGLVAHQEVLFGGTGQLLTIKHDSIDRTSFMPGVLLAVRRASTIKALVYGLDKLL